jgi:hypothetical protein
MRMEDSSPRQLRHLTNTLIEVRKGALSKVGGGTGVPPVTIMARMAMPQGSAHAELKFSATNYPGSPLCTRNKDG